MHLTDYIANERQAEESRAARHALEAKRASGVCFSGMGPGPFTARTDAELLAAARDRMERRGAFAVSPAGRFLLNVSTAQAAAKASGDLPLYSACSRALACCSRGLAGELDHAARCLAEVELCGGDVAEARAALVCVQGDALQMAAE